MNLTMSKILSIKDVKQLSRDSDFTITGVVSKLSRRLDRNNNPFWEITVNDTTGDIIGRAWSLAKWYNTQGGDKFPIDPDNCGINFEGLSVGFIGKTSDFRDQLQYNFNEIYILDQNKYPPKDFTKRSPLSQEFLEETFKDLISKIENEELQNFVNAVFFKHGLWEKFRTWPAAVTYHHAYFGGLLEHSNSVTIGARDLAEHYYDFKIPVNLDLITAGGLLHDIGKLDAYKNSPVPQMNPVGTVIEHVSLGYHKFMSLAEIENLNSDITTAIGHIILSHHGKFEYGSPVLPETPEAMIVSSADEIDFKLAFWKNQIENLQEQVEITEFFPSIGQRLWRGIKF